MASGGEDWKQKAPGLQLCLRITQIATAPRSASVRHRVKLRGQRSGWVVSGCPQPPRSGSVSAGANGKRWSLLASPSSRSRGPHAPKGLTGVRGSRTFLAKPDQVCREEKWARLSAPRGSGCPGDPPNARARRPEPFSSGLGNPAEAGTFLISPR